MPNIPELLLRRALPDEYSANKRFLEDEEITIVSLLDDQGRISTTNHLNDFMVLLTRFEKKVSCLYLLLCFSFYVMDSCFFRSFIRLIIVLYH
jgi:hypothetical protein